VSEVTDTTVKKELWNFKQDPALGSFNINIESAPKDMNISGLLKRVEETAPILWGFLKAFTQWKNQYYWQQWAET